MKRVLPKEILGRINELIDMIPTGKEDSISRADLAKQLNIPDRSVRELIHEARKNSPILSNTSKGGYYLPANKDEANEFIQQQYSYISNINQTIPSVRRWMERKGQRRLDDGCNFEQITGI